MIFGFLPQNLKTQAVAVAFIMAWLGAGVEPEAEDGRVRARDRLPGLRGGGGREQPRQSRVGSVLPDGPGAVSETGRYTRGTGYVTPLDSSPALTRWIRAGSRCAPALCFLWEVGELQVGPHLPGLGGHGELPTAVAVAMPQGQSRMPNPSTGQQ